jgi:predicted component of type VI protein secretion system
VFPEVMVPREVRLAGHTVVVGRRRSSEPSGPDIDLSVPPADPGVSHRHAMLMAQADGGWAVTDTHSANGTWLNGEPTPLTPDQLIALGDGDRLYLGVFSRITVHYDPQVTP